MSRITRNTTKQSIGHPSLNKQVVGYVHEFYVDGQYYMTAYTDYAHEWCAFKGHTYPRCLKVDGNWVDTTIEDVERKINSQLRSRKDRQTTLDERLKKSFINVMGAMP